VRAGIESARADWSARVRSSHALFLLALATIVWYAPLLFGPSPAFTFDDLPSIVEAENVRHLWPPWVALGAPPGSGASGRPLVALSLAVNYALGGLEPRGYHVLNVVLHTLASFALFALARTILVLAAPRAPAATFLALAIALPWAAHPLHTMAIDNVVYRNEVMASLFYVLTIWAGLRSFTSARPRRWMLTSIAACFLGVASKEIVVTAPLALLLFDWTLVSPSLARALRAHHSLYLGLLATWLPLACFVALGDRGESVGFGHEQLGPWHYALTQATALVHYLRLFFWPAPLVLDYDGWPIARSVGSVWWQGSCVLLLLALSTILLLRRKVLGAIGLTAFLVLAPTSTFLPLAGALLGEHRMYLPCAALVAALGIAAARTVSALPSGRSRALVLAGVSLSATLAWGATTRARHADYASELSIWKATVDERPDNPKAWTSLGAVYAARGDREAAEDAYSRALAIQPDYYKARINLGNLLVKHGSLAAAAEQYEEAAAERPDLAVTHYYAGTTQIGLGRASEGAAHLRQALALGLEERLVASCRLELAWALATAADPAVRNGPEALELARSGQGEAPNAHALDVLAAALAETGHFPEAVATLEGALARMESRGAPSGFAAILRQRLESYRAGRAWREESR
jgi:tetratricopeptide (TPR) repeat protein